jgi:hypothetical protein
MQRSWIRWTAAALAAAPLLVGCASTGPKAAGVASASTAADFERIKSLAGTWQAPGPDGSMQVASMIAVSSDGSVVREVMFPGAPHEMTNMYHLDGDAIVVTHYCAAGNQPRMRCPAAKGDVFVFTFADVTNLATPDTEFMSDLELIIIDASHVKQVWRSRKNGQPTEHATFELTRAS